ncbi:MAG: hypothetical protein M3253_08955, partial [Chloroflexota bacterium]|nr:hypothetical protein [Chloroflexota bacterium]
MRRSLSDLFIRASPSCPITTWIEGETWQTDRLADPSAAAIELANFIHVLHEIPPALLGLSEPV